MLGDDLCAEPKSRCRLYNRAIPISFMNEHVVGLSTCCSIAQENKVETELAEIPYCLVSIAISTSLFLISTKCYLSSSLLFRSCLVPFFRTPCVDHYYLLTAICICVARDLVLLWLAYIALLQMRGHQHRKRLPSHPYSEMPSLCQTSMAMRL